MNHAFDRLLLAYYLDIYSTYEGYIFPYIPSVIGCLIFQSKSSPFSFHFSGEFDDARILVIILPCQY